ncbi:hypothetical protein [Microbulbifer sp. JSM ZJ756]|uniref:hypothetical protein n=1 Tax=Microbulbifer sp. JSM ZJ756 TaxID=3376191 RepID=UPI003791D01B
MDELAVVVLSKWHLVLLLWAVCVLLSTHIGMRRGFPVMGFLNGLVLGPLGLLNVITTGDQSRRPCPHCAEDIKKQASLCCHCGRAVS